jgi:DNA invertase Pin-like site-specific DNA recombinase
LVLNVLISVAQWEAETIGERTRAALDVKREKGQRIGGIPFGYQLAADGAQLELNRSERRIIEHIRLRYEQGYSQRRIVNELKHMGFVGRTGKPLSLMQVQRILKNKGD